DPAQRQSSDIDLLVQPHNLPAAEEVLEKLRYVCSAKTFCISQYDHNHETFSPPGKGLHIELHWVTDNVFNLFPKGWLDDAFSRRIPIKSGDLSCDTLSHSDHLIYLAFHHVFQHWSMRLDWVYDISLLLVQLKTADEWRAISQKSVEHHIRIPMELSLTAANLWTGRELPEGFRDFSKWSVPHERELRLMKYSATHHKSLYSCVYLIMQGQPGIREKLRYGWRLILPPLPWLTKYRKSSSNADIPLAHLRRWWFSIVKYR
ncbi:MAG: nucleotidyltransferase family protein, partial [Methanoregula sp.]|nr:nucleotidyltransferase family protein [Methanoregula sp.]